VGSASACAFARTCRIGPRVRLGRGTSFPIRKIEPGVRREAITGDTRRERKSRCAIWIRAAHSFTRSRRVKQISEMLSRARASQRGSSLLLALMIVAILTVVAFAIVQMGSTEADAVGAKRRYDHAVSCSD